MIGKIQKFLSNNVPLIGLALVLLIGTMVNRAFISPENLGNMLRSASIIGLVAVGMTFVVLCGSIDLSVGATFAFCGYLFIKMADINPVLSIVVPLLAGALIGLVNGFLVGRLSIPPFVGTLATMLFVRGAVQIATGEITVKGNLQGFLKSIGRGSLFPNFSIPFVLFIAACLLAAFMLYKRPLGRAMYIVGGNAEAARMMGVNVKNTLLLAHILCGVMAAFGGLVLASRVGSAQPLAGSGYELYAIASVVIGGAQLSGGVGKMSGTFLGTIIMGSFSSIFNMQRVVNPVWQNVVVGGVLLLIIMLQAIVGEKSFANKKKEKPVVEVQKTS